jgi:phage terminase large subunit
VFDNLRIRRIPDEESARFDRLYFGLDHGFAVDPVALVAAHYEPAARTLFLFGEFVKVGASFDTIAHAARALFPPGACITADSAEPRSNDELAHRGLRILPARKGPGSIEHGLRWLQDLSAIVIDPARCPHAAREFTAYRFPPDRLGGFQARYPDKNNHTIDAVRYALEPVIGRRLVHVPNGVKWGL